MIPTTRTGPAGTPGADIDLDQLLHLSEIFYSIQGESSRLGRPCTLIRLAGCHLACSWCDAGYTWKPGEFAPDETRAVSLRQLVDEVRDRCVPMVELTGGEPLLQKASRDLLRLLCDEGFEVLLDTSGGVALEGVDPRVTVVMDIKCPGSGMSERMVWSNLDWLRPGQDEIKFVITDRVDYEWAHEVCLRHDLFGRFELLFSPVPPPGWAGDMRDWHLARQLAHWMLSDASPARLQVQLHRVLWPAALRGEHEGYLESSAPHPSPPSP